MKFDTRLLMFSCALSGLFFSLGVMYVRTEGQYALREAAVVQKHNVELFTQLGEVERSFISCLVMYEGTMVEVGAPRRANIFMSYEEGKKLYDDIILFEPLKRIVLERKNER